MSMNCPFDILKFGNVPIVPTKNNTPYRKNIFFSLARRA